MTDRAYRDLQALYVRLYFDEDVSRDIVENLRQRGFDVLSAREVGQLHLDDDEQLAFAVAQGRALVTHNRHDFELRQQSISPQVSRTWASSSPNAAPAMPPSSTSYWSCWTP